MFAGMERQHREDCFADGFSTAEQPAIFPRGIGGPQVPQVIFRTVAPLSMLAFTIELHHSNFVYVTTQRKNMRNYQSTNQTPQTPDPATTLLRNSHLRDPTYEHFIQGK